MLGKLGVHGAGDNDREARKKGHEYRHKGGGPGAGKQKGDSDGNHHQAGKACRPEFTDGHTEKTELIDDQRGDGLPQQTEGKYRGNAYPAHGHIVEQRSEVSDRPSGEKGSGQAANGEQLLFFYHRGDSGGYQAHRVDQNRRNMQAIGPGQHAVYCHHDGNEHGRQCGQ